MFLFFVFFTKTLNLQILGISDKCEHVLWVQGPYCAQNLLVFCLLMAPTKPNLLCLSLVSVQVWEPEQVIIRTIPFPSTKELGWGRGIKDNPMVVWGEILPSNNPGCLGAFLSLGFNPPETF